MKQYSEEISYEIVENGYEIYKEGRKWITQPEPYAKLYIPNGTYEENCLAQLEEITRPAEEPMSEYDRGYEQAILDMLELGEESEE